MFVLLYTCRFYLVEKREYCAMRVMLYERTVPARGWKLTTRDNFLGVLVEARKWGGRTKWRLIVIAIKTQWWKLENTAKSSYENGSWLETNSFHYGIKESAWGFSWILEAQERWFVRRSTLRNVWGCETNAHLQPGWYVLSVVQDALKLCNWGAIVARPKEACG